MPFETGVVEFRIGRTLIHKIRLPADQLETLVQAVQIVHRDVCPLIVADGNTIRGEDVGDAILAALMLTYDLEVQA